MATAIKPFYLNGINVVARVNCKRCWVVNNLTLRSPLIFIGVFLSFSVDQYTLKEFIKSAEKNILDVNGLQDSCRIFYDTQRLNNAWNALINSLWYCMFFILHENLIPRFFCIMSICNDIKPPKPLFLINRKSHKLSESNCEISKSAQVRLAILQYFILSSRLITNLQ